MKAALAGSMSFQTARREVEAPHFAVKVIKDGLPVEHIASQELLCVVKNALERHVIFLVFPKFSLDVHASRGLPNCSTY
jgi:hypothetical protein